MVEFIMAACDKEKVLTEANLKRAFEAFDLVKALNWTGKLSFKDKDGTISAENLKMVIGGTKNYSEDLWTELIAEVDKNQDGLVRTYTF